MTAYCHIFYNLTNVYKNGRQKRGKTYCRPLEDDLWNLRTCPSLIFEVISARS